jgi:two-component system alkaline phosphatase synthesis response regulator PhoP
MQKKHILVVDDDRISLKLIKHTLITQGFEIIEATDGKSALDYISNNKIDAALLDLNLPDFYGLEILKFIRSKPSICNIPIIILTSNDDKTDTVIALELGADDYIVKPFHKRELIARLNVCFRRMNQNYASFSSELSFGELTIDLDKRIVKVNVTEINLTFKEFEILSLLATNPGKVFSRDALINKLWGENYFAETRTIDNHIASLRSKLGDKASKHNYIETIRNVGYKFRKQ